MKTFFKVLAALIGVFVLAIGGFTVWGYIPVAEFGAVDYEPRAPEQWPTQSWQRSTPEEQGMSSETLAAMWAVYEAAAAEDPELYIDSLTVVRHGAIVAEFYNNPLFPRDELHVMHSVTKSLVGALVGIAIERGHIASVDVPVVEIFPDRTIQNLDERKRALTIRDLLSMQTGMHSRDSYLYAHEGLFALQHAEDWLQFALDLPMAAEPGERFDYSNVSTFLLSTILMQTTGVDPLDFARQHLFGPLGITEVRWEWNADRQPIAWARMWLKPDDMAKIGLLYLQKGAWDGTQVLPAQWVRDSLTPWAYPKNAVNILQPDMSKDGDKSNQNFFAQRFFRPFADGYGYQWWLDRDGPFTALGTSGQYISVAPEQDLVFVATAKARGLAQFMPATLFHEHVLPAVESESALPPNPEAAARLAALAGPPKRVEQATAVPALPAIASRISGRTYSLETNPFSTDNLRFVFEADSDHATLAFTARESWDVAFRVGLDGVRRLTDTHMGTFAAVGGWTGPATFAVDVEIVGYSTFDRWEFSFEGDRVQVVEHSISGEFSYAGQAK